MQATGILNRRRQVNTASHQLAPKGKDGSINLSFAVNILTFSNDTERFWTSSSPSGRGPRSCVLAGEVNKQGISSPIFSSCHLEPEKAATCRVPRYPDIKGRETDFNKTGSDRVPDSERVRDYVPALPPSVDAPSPAPTSPSSPLANRLRGRPYRRPASPSPPPAKRLRRQPPGIAIPAPSIGAPTPGIDPAPSIETPAPAASIDRHAPAPPSHGVHPRACVQGRAGLGSRDWKTNPSVFFTKPFTKPHIEWRDHGTHLTKTSC